MHWPGEPPVLDKRIVLFDTFDYARARREGFRVIVTCGKADLLAGRTVPRPFSPLLLTSLPFCYAEFMEMTA